MAGKNRVILRNQPFSAKIRLKNIREFSILQMNALCERDAGVGLLRFAGNDGGIDSLLLRINSLLARI